MNELINFVTSWTFSIVILGLFFIKPIVTSSSMPENTYFGAYKYFSTKQRFFSVYDKMLIKFLGLIKLNNIILWWSKFSLLNSDFRMDYCNIFN